MDTSKGWEILAYLFSDKYHGLNFMFGLCHNQSFDRTGSDALTLNILLPYILEKQQKPR